MQLLTNEQVALPVNVSDLEKYLQGTDDGFYQTALTMAGEYFVAATCVELLPRQWFGQVERNGGIGGLAPIGNELDAWLGIPRWPLISVELLKLDGVDVTPLINDKVKPARVAVGRAKTIEIELTAGHNTVGQGSGHGHGHGATVIDERICTAIMMLAGYIVEHRGACDLTEAAIKSGAAMLIDQLKIQRVLV